MDQVAPANVIEKEFKILLDFYLNSGILSQQLRNIMNENIELTSLVGLHKLSAVGFKEEETKEWSYNEPRDVMLFTLDGKTYKAIEDDNDGYRSTMAELTLTDEKPQEQFEPIEVLCRHVIEHEGSYGGEDDMLQFIDIKTGNIILEVGTENVGDYYPGFVATFHKERLAK